MCGFAGMIGNKPIEDSFIIKKMMDTISYRGPDDRCYAVATQDKMMMVGEKELGLECYGVFGFNRLSIRDVSTNGRQPMFSQDSKTILLFNGEIYNVDYLKSFLPDYSFVSRSDTEIILALYLKFGFDKAIRMLDGMFSISLISFDDNKLYLSRDRMGIKPLYYCFFNEQIVFSSEIKSLLCEKSIRKSINIEALKEFFVFGDSINGLLLDKIYEVYPGEYIVYDLERIGISDCRHYKYFDVNKYDRPLIGDVEFNQTFLDKTENVLGNAVKTNLLSDVEIGCQLSGGIDSSLVTYFSHKYQKCLNTVSIIPEDSKYSEKEYINHVVDLMPDIRPHFFYLKDEDAARCFCDAVYHYESIMTYHNFVAIMGLAKTAKEFVTVLLSGEGADELFGGYTWFEDGFYVTKYFNGESSTRPMVRGMENARDYSEFAVMSTDTIPFDVSSKILNMYLPYNDIVQKRVDYFNSFTGTDFDKHIKYELTTRLRSLLKRQDKATMAYSIENRVPFLNNEVVDLAFSLPQEFLIGDSEPVGKKVLKMICSRVFGDDFSYRRKMGLPIPIHKLMMTKSFKELFYDLLLPGIKNRGIFRYKEINNQYERLDSSINRWEFAPLWKALSFEMWCQCFIDMKGLYNA